MIKSSQQFQIKKWDPDASTETIPKRLMLYTDQMLAIHGVPKLTSRTEEGETNKKLKPVFHTLKNPT